MMKLVSKHDTDMTSLLNLGPTSSEWLEAVDIRSPGDLRAVGAVEAYWKVKQAGYNPSLNLLYALEGAITHTHWNRLSNDDRHRLMIELDARMELEARK